MLTLGIGFSARLPARCVRVAFFQVQAVLPRRYRFSVPVDHQVLPLGLSPRFKRTANSRRNMPASSACRRSGERHCRVVLCRPLDAILRRRSDSAAPGTLLQPDNPAAPAHRHRVRAPPCSRFGKYRLTHGPRPPSAYFTLGVVARWPAPVPCPYRHFIADGFAAFLLGGRGSRLAGLAS